jgi:THO complex subunit 4
LGDHSEADIAARLGKLNPLPKTTGSTGGRGQGSSNQSNNNAGGRNSSNNSRQQQAKPAQPREKKKPHVKTAEELDAEMDTYMGDVSLLFCYPLLAMEIEFCLKIPITCQEID